MTWYRRNMKTLTAIIDPVHFPHSHWKFYQSGLVKVVCIFKKIVRLLLQSFNNGMNYKQRVKLSKYEYKYIRIQTLATNLPSSSKSRRKASSFGVLAFFLFLAFWVRFLGAMMKPEKTKTINYFNSMATTLIYFSTWYIFS